MWYLLKVQGFFWVLGVSMLTCLGYSDESASSPTFRMLWNPAKV